MILDLQTQTAGKSSPMDDPTLHLRAEMLIALKQKGMPADLMLRLVVHLKHLCPVCASEVERFAKMNLATENPSPQLYEVGTEASGALARRIEGRL